MKKLWFAIAMGAVLFSCSEKNKTEKKGSYPNGTVVEYFYKDADRDIPVTITAPPQRAALFNPYSVEMLLAMGLEDKIIVGTTEGDVPPEYQKAYEKVPQRFVGHSFKMTKEAFLLAEPDFAVGNMSAESTGSPEELIAQGIAPFDLKSLDTPNATLEMVYEDIEMLGKIFNVPDRATKIVEGMKKKLADAQKEYAKIPENEKKKVLILSYRKDKGGIAAFSALATDLVAKANGVNIYKDIDTRYEFVSNESVLERNPDAIFIIDIVSRNNLQTMQQKKDIFYNDPVLKATNAVKNGQVYEVNLAEVGPSPRNVDFIIKLNKILYPEKK